MTEISIVDLDKAEVLAALFNGARAQGAGFIHYSNVPMTALEARSLIEKNTRFDYVQGRVLKVNLSGDSFDPWLYDRDNGMGAAKLVIDLLRATGMVNPEEVEMQSLEGTREAAKSARDQLGTKHSLNVEGDTLVLGLGLGDLADELEPKLNKILGNEEEE